MIGIFFILLCSFFSSLQFVIMKALYQLNPHITFVDHLLSKGIIPLLIYFWIAKKSGINLFNMSRNMAVLIFLRVVCGVTANVLFTITTNYISVSLVTIITNMTPMFVGLFSYIILAETITCFEILCMFGGFSGIVIISLNSSSGSRETYLVAVVLTVLSAVVMALGYTLLRKINLVMSPIYGPFYFFIGTLSL